VATALVAAAVALPTAAAGAPDGAKLVKMTDDCEPTSFNAAIGPGTCVGDGRTTFGNFIGQLVAQGSADDWAFSKDLLNVKRDRSLIARNDGGEFHTFTEVAAFGGGCVPEINAILGLLPVAECNDPTVFVTSGAPPGERVTVTGLPRGTHRFMCLIHPWMRTTVNAR
jgi:hypothetical protein